MIFQFIGYSGVSSKVSFHLTQIVHADDKIK
jgi:hypothetical protein